MLKRAAVLLSALMLLSVLALPVVNAGGSGGGGGATSITADQLDASVLIKWMQLLYDRVEAEAISAPAASRIYAYAGITAYQSVMPGIPGAIPLSGQLTNLGDMPELPDDGVYDWPSSANAALSTVIAGLFPETATDTQKAITALRDSQQNSRQKATNAEEVQRSMTFGDSVGQAILDWAALDNYTETRDMTWDIPTGDPSLWIPTAPNMKPVEPFWGQIRPFALYDPDACAQKNTMDFSTDPKSTFYAQAMEVKTTGDNLTNDQKDTARFWVDTPGQTGTPAGHWVLIENQLISVLDLKLDRSAMMYALVGVALGDSFIAAWSQKYEINLLRPVTYIDNYIDPNWQPFIASPGFPEYPSGHSVVSSAAAEVLTGMFGTVAFTDHSGQQHGLANRSFTSIQAAASQAAISRLYGGIHFRAAIENGLREGQCIGQQVLNYVLLRSVPQGE